MGHEIYRDLSFRASKSNLIIFQNSVFLIILMKYLWKHILGRQSFKNDTVLLGPKFERQTLGQNGIEKINNQLLISS